ncbi:p23/wos2 family protein [Streptomyces cinnamoneus]|uniref:p23/wos2 family protein n=1 Tax=Streptomyces cinnamoneus TaxID=53446 RepID=UPI00341D67DE
MTAITPMVLWAQRADVVYLTVEVADPTDTYVDLAENHVRYHATTADGKEYAFKLDLYGAIDPTDSRKVPSRRNLLVTMRKQSQGWWPQLTREKKKIHWIKIDFSRWKNEGDADDKPVADKSWDFDPTETETSILADLKDAMDDSGEDEGAPEEYDTEDASPKDR